MPHRLVNRLVVLSVVLFALFPILGTDGRAAARSGSLSIADRVAAQRALDEIAYRHEIGAKRPFEEAAPDAVLERKVRTYLKKSVALERFWSTPVTSAMLDAEIDRLARSSRDAGRLAELYAALGNDALLVRECLARPLLVDRLARSFFDGDPSLRSARTVRGEPVHRTWDSWWAQVEPTLDESSVQVAAAPARALALPKAVAGSLGCAPGDSWDNQSLDDPPDARADHVAVWSGSEMIIWGGSDPTRRFNTGALYNPWTDTWRPMTVLGAPSPNQSNGTPDQGFWTGSELIVWGGAARGGGLYDPGSDRWRPMNKMGAPTAPGVQAWMGSRLFVFDAIGHKAAAYDPAADSWTTLATTGAPVDARVAIWTGRYIVTSSTVVGRYDPVADAWLPVSQTGAIAGMPQLAAAIGPDVLFAGYYGYRYSPDTDTWSPAAATPYDILGGPAFNSRQVWTGHELLVWGGRGYTSSTYMGGPYRYDPVADTWSVTTVPDGLWARSNHTLVWTGSMMIAWGGKRRDPYFDTGGRYDPATDKWTAVSTGHSIRNAGKHIAVWTGNEMIIWGGDYDYGIGPSTKGARYDPATDSWATVASPFDTSVPVDAPMGGSLTAFWDGDEMLVWGGTGARYNPISDSWRDISPTGAPVTPNGHAAVWTGTRMLVWGGLDMGAALGSQGGAYDPVNDSWTPIATIGAPTSRTGHNAIWTGTEMVVWGGNARVSATQSSLTNTGGRYDPALNTWRPTSLIGAPAARFKGTAVWTGTEMIVRGGSQNSPGDAGGRYDPISDTWRGIAPGDPQGSTAVWTGREMIVWGAAAPSGTSSAGTGGRYNPLTDAWTPIAIQGAPSARVLHSAIWTGDRMIVWGGGGAQTLVMRNGGAYVPEGTNHAPIAALHAADRAECTSPDGARVTLDGAASSDPDTVAGGDGDIVSYEWIEGLGTASQASLGTGATLDVDLPLGSHAIALRVTDACGSTSVATTDVVVEDTVAPALALTVDPSVLWPLDKKLRAVNVRGTVSDACDASPAVVLTGVAANEPAGGDIAGADLGASDFSVELRATRAPAGSGRVYRITYEARDAAGNTVDRVVEVTVPHDRRSGAAAPLTLRTEPVRGGTRPAGP